MKTENSIGHTAHTVSYTWRLGILLKTYSNQLDITLEMGERTLLARKNRISPDKI